MSDQADVTGRDTYLLVEALTFTVEARSGLPIELRPDHNVADMKRLVKEFVKHGAVTSRPSSVVGLKLSYKQLTQLVFWLCENRF